MSAEKHPSYGEEKDRLEYTLKYVKKSLDASENQKYRIDEEISKGKRHFDSSDSQSYIGLMVNTMLQDRVNLKIRNLTTALGKPYFARIDFKEDGKDVPEKLYIGKMVLIRDEDQEIIIVDWRAPIANLYYESRLGNATYVCPDGNINGELSLKRQFTIDGGELKDIFDIDITTNDEFLQNYLGANADNRLKDIVSSIQVEQNRVIRSDMWKPLIVQGAAGSGKTTIALHRIAYLIYTFEKTFNPENFMIIAPNRLFLNYISNVLPELGVERVKQSTFEDFALELIGKKLKIEDSNDKLNSFVNMNMDEDDAIRNEFLKRSCEFKSSMAFKDVLNEYVSIIEKSYIPHEDFKIGSFVIYTYEDINALFLNEYKDLPFLKRMDEIKKHLLNRLKLKKDNLIGRLQYECDRKIDRLKFNMEESEERRKIIVEAIDYKNDMIKNIEGLSKRAVKEYISGIMKKGPFDYYREFINNRDIFLELTGRRTDNNIAEFIQKHTMDVLDSGYVEIEDLAPIIYIKYLIHGINEKIPVRHIVVDEAQDFSVFQFYVMKKIVKNSSFTILGDLCQGIHSYRGIRDWNDVVTQVFEDGRVEYLTMEQSYRTTVEIMEAANSVIRKINRGSLVLAKPVIRHGDRVLISKKGSMEEIAHDISQKIKSLRSRNYKSIAVICKTMDECEKMLGMLKKSKEKIIIITGKEKEYKGGIVVVPSYLAKGLEFDAVMIANCSSLEYKYNELDAKLLYVSMTRPLHNLYIYYQGEISPLLSDMPGKSN